MTFGFPLVLLLLLLIPAILFLRRRGWGRPATVLYPEAESVKAVFQGGRRPGSGLREKLRLAAVMVLIIAAARPQQRARCNRCGRRRSLGRSQRDRWAPARRHR